MKKIISFFTLAFAICICASAQSYLNVYQDNVVISQISYDDIDSLSVTKTEPHIISLWSKGEVFQSYASNEIDSITVTQHGGEPFSYIGIVGFNDSLYVKDIDILSSRTDYVYNDYIEDLPKKDGSLLYYAIDNALNLLENQNAQTPLSSINLITFTDGLDQGSIMMTDKYDSSREYLKAMNQRIKNTKIGDIPITAYSVGLQGNDVADLTLFKQNLQQLSSDSCKAFEVESIYDLEDKFQDIAKQIISISTRQTMSVKIPGVDSGTLVRFIFDGESPENSQLYIEGTFSLKDCSLHDVSYHGIKASTGSTIQGTQDGIFITYTFTGMRLASGEGLIPTTYTKHFYKLPSSTSWQINSEFSPNNNTQRRVSHSGTSVVLILDCSSSLGKDINTMKYYAKTFVDMIAENAQPFEIKAPQGFKAELDAKNFIVHLTWEPVVYAEEYRIYRANRSGKNYKLIAEGITGTSWTDENPNEGDNYYHIDAVGHNIENYGGSSSGPVECLLETPDNLQAEMALENNTLGIRMSWDNVPYARGYNIYRYDSRSDKYKMIAENVSESTWFDKQPLNGYNKYKVCATSNSIYSSQSTYCSVNYILSTPSNVTDSIYVDSKKKLCIALSWDEVPFAEAYNIYDQNSEKLLAANVKSNKWIDDNPTSRISTASDRHDFRYMIEAVRYGLTSSRCKHTTTCVMMDPKSPELNLEQKDDRLAIKITWNRVSLATGYNVYRKSSSSDDCNLIAKNVSDTIWIDDSPIEGWNYYKILAVGDKLISSSSWSNSIKYGINSPSEVRTSIDKNDLFVNVTWDDVEWAQEYEIWRNSKSSGEFTLLSEHCSTNSFTDKSPLNGDNYYKIFAVGYGLKTASGTLSQKINCALDRPVITASLEDKDLVVDVEWETVKFAKYYNVYKGKDDYDYTLVAENITSTSWKDTTPRKGDNYYRVCAVNGNVISEMSSSSNVNVQISEPKVVAELSDKDFSVNVSWSPVQYAKKYDVYYKTYYSNYELIAENLTDTLFRHESPVEGRNYYYVVAKNGDIKNSSYSVSINVIFTLDTPTNVAASKVHGQSKIQVSWDDIARTTKYTVYRANLEKGEYKVVAEGVDTNNWLDESPLLGRNFYKIEGHRDSLTSNMSYVSNGANAFVDIYDIKGVSFGMVAVEGGTFTMGADDVSNYTEGKPAHNVTLSDFYIAETEVTRGLFLIVMGDRYRQSEIPVSGISWNDCQEFIKKLNVLTGKNFRLPTEAEWEFAAKGGNKTKYTTYSGSEDIEDVGWFNNNSYRGKQIVATKACNELGIFDMTGNVCEWCSDWYGEYSENPQTNPQGPETGTKKIIRGGSYYNVKTECQNTYRGSSDPSGTSYVGFRLALSK